MKLNSVFIFSLLIIYFTLGCGASKVPNSLSSSSRINPAVPPTSGNTTNYFAECNHFAPQNNVSASGYLSTYYNPAGQYVSSYINFKFSNPPAEIINSDDYHLKIYTWRIDTNGQRQTNNTPVNMYLIQRGTGAISTLQPINTLSKSIISGIISDRGLSNYGISTNNFFSRHNIVLTGIDLNYDAILIALYKEENGTTNAVGSIDVLVPAFEANPQKYKDKNPYSALYNLHPHISKIGLYSNDKEYFTLSEQICQSFVTSYTRGPASVPAPEIKEPGFFTNLILSIKKIWNRLF